MIDADFTVVYAGNPPVFTSMTATETTRKRPRMGTAAYDLLLMAEAEHEYRAGYGGPIRDVFAAVRGARGQSKAANPRVSRSSAPRPRPTPA